MSDNILTLNGLSVEFLQRLSFRSQLGVSLKKDLKYFDKEQLLSEMEQMTNWYYIQDLFEDVALDYRIKSMDSIQRKLDKYYPDHQARKVFNDVLGFRAFCDNYEDVLELQKEGFRIADMSTGKANDDGYRGVHVYYQTNNSYYPIEIQFNTLYDRQFNNWLHENLYKKVTDNNIGIELRAMYEKGCIRAEKEFEEALEHVLSGR